MQTIIFSLVIAFILLLLLPLRVKFWLKIDNMLVATIKIELVFTLTKKINLLEPKPLSKKNNHGKAVTKRTLRIALNVIYPEEIVASLILSGEELLRDINIIASYQLFSNAILRLVETKYNGKYSALGKIALGGCSTFSIQFTLWFNITTLSFVLVDMLINQIRDKIKKMRKRI